MSIIELAHVNKSYHGNTVLDDINLRIDSGNFVTIIGRSGSGKTTLLRLLNGLVRADSGSVSIRGKSIRDTNMVQLRRSIGYVIQEAGLFPHLKIKDNIAYVLRLQKKHPTEIEHRVLELMSLLQLDPNLANRYPHELSGGQRQRVGIARALAAAPDIILMDEPFGAVDEITREILQQEVKNIQRRAGTTIIFITHDIGEALTLGDKVIVLHQGNIEQYDTPQNICDHPASTFVSILTGKR
ncbi:MAG: ABC transporter ATP-binding protein [Cardiobacteriaceae bacterium]|nr:ABC transporter ATP-binding protein [Cardiobacteriaceae bacterium]